MRSHEQPLKQQAVVAERGAALPADAGSRKAHRGALDKLLLSRDVAAGRGKAAAGVLYE